VASLPTDPAALLRWAYAQDVENGDTSKDGVVSTVVRTTRIDPLKAGNSTGEVRKGSTVIAERLATAIVDKPGQTR
jgi:hypothetical protein